jgi:hypothetical protein
MIDAKVKSWHLPSDGKSNSQQMRQALFATIKQTQPTRNSQTSSTQTGKTSPTFRQFPLQQEETEPTPPSPRIVAQEMIALVHLISGEAFPGDMAFLFVEV